MKTEIEQATKDRNLAIALGPIKGGLTGRQWGTAWDGEDCQPFVLQCLRKYLNQEGHGRLVGRTVREVAQIMRENYGEASQEELNAISCLLEHGKGGEVV
jgi:hypothetical protein